MRVPALIAAAVVAVLAASAPDVHGHPDCFGAAARDPEHPCENARLRFSVVPRPSIAQIEPSAPCTPVPQLGPPDVCAFGVAPAVAGATIALVGDSHAVHWRATLDVIARTKRWRGLTLYRSSCPFTKALTDQRQPERRRCRSWGGRVIRWFEAHPHVHTAFISQHSRGRVIAPEGRDAFEAQVAGYAAAWRALPPSVRHIVVVRDPPYIEATTLACVRRAMARHKRPGVACALPRRTALKRDAAIVAVQRLRSPRVQAIDLTRFMCDAALCYPVVGGALVKKDPGHLTRVFAETLAPYFARKLNRLMASWD
jgi:hypothetical protein